MSETSALPALQPKELSDLPNDDLDQRVQSGHRKVEEIKERVGELMLEGLVAAGQTGAALKEKKDRLQYGMWTTWLDKFFPASRRTAQNYMRIADNWEWVREEAKRVSEPLSYRRAIRGLQQRERQQFDENVRERVIEHARGRIEEAVETDRITEEQASRAREDLLPDAEKVDEGQLKPSTFRRRLTKRLDRIEQENLPEPERRSREAGDRFTEAYEAGDRFRARLQDLRDEGDREWLGTMSALKLASLLTQIQGAASSLMTDIREAAPDDHQLPERSETIEVEAREKDNCPYCNEKPKMEDYDHCGRPKCRAIHLNKTLDSETQEATA